MTALLNHLWQSTLFAGIAALLALALRKNQARSRYSIWLAASLKFLVPFSMLVSLGNRVEFRSAPAVIQPAVSIAIDDVARPFAAAAAHTSVPGAPSIVPQILLIVWFCGCLAVLSRWTIRWRRIRASVRAATPLHLDFPIPAMYSTALMEPGIFGIFRPVLLLPQGIAQRLTTLQLESILAHELCHARRRDNLAAALHMMVEAIFWFHPLVWWIGARLIEERERACDEEVLRSGSEPAVYAESILQVCKFYLESPLECAAGVTGSDLKKRVESIMSGGSARKLSAACKLLLSSAAILTVSGPVIFGLLDAPNVVAQEQKSVPGFEVESIKRSNPEQRGSAIPPTAGGRFRATNVTPLQLIQYAYHTSSDRRITGATGWLASERYDVVAKAETNVPDKEIRPMVLKLLQDRFGLKFHHEKKTMPVYLLTVAKGGPKFTLTEGCVQDPDHKQPCGGFRVQHRSYVSGQQVSAGDLAEVLEALLDEPVLDRTGLKGVFGMTLQWVPDDTMRHETGDTGAPQPDALGASLFTAIQEQLGLKLEKQKAAVDIVVIDHAEKPSEN